MAKIDGMTVKDVADVAVGIFILDTLRIAAENYGPEHSIIPGMRRIFLAALSGKEFAELTDEELAGFEKAIEETRTAFEEGKDGGED